MPSDANQLAPPRWLLLAGLCLLALALRGAYRRWGTPPRRTTRRWTYVEIRASQPVTVTTR